MSVPESVAPTAAVSPHPSPTRPGEQEGDVERLLRRVSTLHFLMTHRLAQALGLSQVELFAVNLVYLSGGLSAGTLAHETGLTTSATTRLIDRLERQALLRRVPDPTDRRRIVVQLDPHGAPRLDEKLQTLREIGQGAAQPLTDSERSGLTRYLKATADGLETFVRRLPPCPDASLPTPHGNAAPGPAPTP